MLDRSYDLNQPHHPIIVIGGLYEGRTGESLGQDPKHTSCAICVLIPSDEPPFKAAIPYEHLQSRLCPGTGCIEVYYRRKGLL